MAIHEGKRLKEFRKRLGLDQKGMGKVLGYSSQQQMSLLELKKDHPKTLSLHVDALLFLEKTKRLKQFLRTRNQIVKIQPE